MAMTLPAAAWRQRPGLDRLVAALGDARFVGGAVRDTLLGLSVADIDVATGHPPEEAARRLEAAGIKVVPTGLAHGTLTAISADTVVEVTTLRRDVATDGRHAIVAFTDDWRADAARRDFTINALYAEPESGLVHDYFDGLADLETRRVRFIGDPLQRIAEDHLRILRFFRFYARFGDAIDDAGLAACVARANDLMALSRERIAAELLKLLVTPGALQTVLLMVEHGIFKAVLPEIVSTTWFVWLVETETHAAVDPDPIRRLAALLPRDPVTGEAVANRLKLSKAQRQRLILALTERGGSPWEDAYRHGREAAMDRVLLADDFTTPRELKEWPIPCLPLSGGALIARGLAAGPAVAAALKAVEAQWIAEGFPGQARVDAIADSVVAGAISAQAASASSGRP
ncbi:CCA tRNA nucleotidyltransferase [uncultured Sphingomonas sp.]|uniref:CCA tRNA nucleotidyltransferase n=1 Tax=uncultured Sphingomonas sp. TaxID=158754 RepID=UPI0035CBB20F